MCVDECWTDLEQCSDSAFFRSVDWFLTRSGVKVEKREKIEKLEKKNIIENNGDMSIYSPSIVSGHGEIWKKIIFSNFLN